MSKIKVVLCPDRQSADTAESRMIDHDGYSRVWGPGKCQIATWDATSVGQGTNESHASVWVVIGEK